MNFTDYSKWFRSVYGDEVTKVILDQKNECIIKYEQKLLDFFKNYQRYELIPDEKNCYRIKGCNECISKGIAVRKQDTPGFLGKLNEIKYVIIGLEVNIPKKTIEKSGRHDIHIAFDQFNTEKKEHRLFTRLRLIFPDIKEKAYVTDIAKCRSTNLHQSHQNCLETHFFEELELLLAFAPDLRIIFQGTSVEYYFSKNFKLVYFSTPENDEVKSKKKRRNKFLFKRQYLIFDDIAIPTVTFPHGAGRNSYLWNEIEEPEILSDIKTKLTEFNFY